MLSTAIRQINNLLTYNSLIVLFLKYRFMLVKVNRINDEAKVINVTKLDIDDYGSVIPLEELELKLPLNEDMAEILRNSQYAVLSVQGNLDENGRYYRHGRNYDT